MAPVDNSQLERWRSLRCEQVLPKLATYAKRDASFVPIKDPRSSRWHVRVEEREFELLITGHRFWDTRAECGGGGAVDLVMHLNACRFKEAVQLLCEGGF